MSAIRIKIKLVIVLILAGISLIAQDDIVIAYGKFKVEWGNLDGTRIKLYENNTLIDTYRPTGNGKFEFELKLNNEYMFWFEKSNYVTKKVFFNTAVPSSVTSDPEFIPFPDFDFYVTLFKSYPEVDTMFFENPVGKILYNAKINDFDWDKDYTLEILKRMEEIEEDIKRKYEEEEKNKKDKEKQKKEELARKKELEKQKREEEEARKKELEKQKQEEEKKLAQQAKEQKDKEEKAKKEKTEEPVNQIVPEPLDEPIAQNQEKPVDIKEEKVEPKTIEKEVPEEPEPKTVIAQEKISAQEPISGSPAVVKNTPQLPKTNTVNTVQVAGKTVTRIPVDFGNTQLIYLKVEYSWGGRYFFIQDENNEYRNISENYFNKMTEGKN